MPRFLRQAVTMVAIYAIALNVVFFGFAPAWTGVANDTLSAICRSIGETSGDHAPSDTGHRPSHGCQHCNLCSATRPPPAPDVALNIVLVPPQVLAVLVPASTPLHVGVVSNPRLARGPPQQA